MTHRARKLARPFRQASPLPGFGLSLGYTLIYLTLIVLLPLVAILLHSLRGGLAMFLHAIATPRVFAACRVTLESALLAALAAAAFGFLVAWVLARYDFPGRRIVDALIDLPFALPTAVAGISLTTLYARSGWLGRYLEPHGVHIIFTQLGISLAMAFVGLPFVVRSVQPVLEDIDVAMEEAAASLGAGNWQLFSRILAPVCLPSLVTGTALAFARAAGEYGSVIFIAGNMPMKTEIAALLVVTKLEEFDYVGASAIAVAMLALSFAIMLALNLFQWRLQARRGERI
ncbi:MAG: sulfate ABC transporter permease subunit CysT [Terracidiphilus sp.]|jgi:sulfate transport system permease protein